MKKNAVVVKRSKRFFHLPVIPGVKGMTILLVAVMCLILSCDSGGYDPVNNADVVERFIVDANAHNYTALTGYMLPTASWYSDLDAEWWESEIEGNLPLDLTAYNIPTVYLRGADGSEFYFTLQSHNGDLKISRIVRDDDVIGEVLFR